ncbi:MAG TPA: DMT family transporter [Thermoleophilaceae bacterium]|jgi:drug/metabolite transporter (DMT)-like permease
MALLLGFAGVLGFSFTLPATRAAVDGLDPAFVGIGRTVAAAAIAAVILLARRERLPPRDQLRRLGLVAIGVVFGFPLLSALALHHLPSSHAAVTVGILPAATAVAAVIRGGERPSRAFWLASAAGLVAVLAFAASKGAGVPRGGDLLLLASVALAALGYAEGASLAREIGGWRVISWALVLSLPLTVPITLVAASGGVSHADSGDWLCFAYVALFSQYLAFFPWYAGLARGGTAKIGQVQLAQPLLTLIWSAALLDEQIGATTVLAAAVVLLSVAATQRTQVERGRQGPLLASSP